MISNRNQRAWLSRLRTSSHQLRVESGRWSKPHPIPESERFCLYCSEDAVDNECHFLQVCPSFANQRRCFYSRLGSLMPNFCNLSDRDKLSTISCSTSAKAAKVTNKYISIVFRARQNIDSGDHISNLTFPPMVEFYVESDLNLSNCSTFSGTLSSCSFSSDTSGLSEF